MGKSKKGKKINEDSKSTISSNDDIQDDTLSTSDSTDTSNTISDAILDNNNTTSSDPDVDKDSPDVTNTELDTPNEDTIPSINTPVKDPVSSTGAVPDKDKIDTSAIENTYIKVTITGMGVKHSVLKNIKELIDYILDNSTNNIVFNKLSSFKLFLKYFKNATTFNGNIVLSDDKKEEVIHKLNIMNGGLK